MSRTKMLIHLLEGLEKHEFDRLVKLYLNEEYHYNKIVFTDGNSDTGIDIKVFDLGSTKIQFQLTVQKSKTQQEKVGFEKKLEEDLVKAKRNYVEYGLSNRLFFFYSNTLTNDRIRKYRQLALTNYGIELELIEANRIAQESENIPSIQALLYKLNEFGDNVHINGIFDNEQENLIFDIVSFGKASELKLQIVEAFILQSLFLSGELDELQIQKICNDKFIAKGDIAYYKRIISNLLTNKRIEKSGKDKYQLTYNEKYVLTNKNEQYSVDQKLFTNGISQILERFDQQLFLKDYVLQLKTLYVENFNRDLNEILNNKNSSQLDSVTEEFTQFINIKVKDDDISNAIAKELLSFCVSNKFIQKLAASKVFCESTNYEKLQSYLNNKKKIYIDTTIAIFAICYFYKGKTGFDDYFFKSSRDLLLFSKGEKIKLYLSEQYLRELSNHVREAFNLIPFTEINNFTTLGSSRNVFYKYYIYLIGSHELDEDITFASFLNKFKFSRSMNQKMLHSTLESHLENVGIVIEKISKDYDYSDTIDMFYYVLNDSGKSKTNFSIENDSLMVQYLSDRDVEIHNLEPVFATWDKSFFKVHNQHLSSYPSSNYWIIVTPNRLVDVYSLLKFSINSETVTENLLALISDDIIENTHSLMDSITAIMNPEDEVNLEYVTKIINIKNEELNRLDHTNHNLPPDNLGSDTVVDYIFFKLHEYSEKFPEKGLVFKKIFSNREATLDVIELLNTLKNDFYDRKPIKEVLFSRFDALVVKYKDA